MLHHTRTFEEKRRRSKSADPSRRRKTDIFFSEQTNGTLDVSASEYKKAFVWPKSQLDSLDEESMKKRLNPSQKQHAAGLSSRKAALHNKAHVIVNSNGSSSIVIANEPTDYALTTGSATNLATLTSSLTQDAIRPLTSMALVDSVDLNKSASSNGSQVNKSATITNINDYANHSSSDNRSNGSTGSARKTTESKTVESKPAKDPNNNISAAPVQNGALNEELLLEKLSKLNTYESIYGKKAGATTLFQRVEVISPTTLNKMSKKSEYKSKLKPFAQYCYVPGKGWFKPKKIKATEEVQAKQIEEIATPALSIKPQDASSVKSQAITEITEKPVQAVTESKAVSINGVEEVRPATATPAKSTADEVDASIAEEREKEKWYREALERKLKANEFRYRSEFGNPILGRSSLEEVYKRASGNHWQASSDPKFTQLQQMRGTNSAFLPYDQHKKRLLEDKVDGSKIRETAKAKATPSKTPRAKSVPPRKKSTGSAPAAAKTPAAAQSQPAKVWIKPKAKETTTNGDANAPKKVQRPPTANNNLDKELKQAQKPAEVKKVVNGGGRASPPVIQAGPVRTTQIKTPEDLLVGIKSPPPENFIDRLDNEPINWSHSTASPSLNSNATYTNYNPTSIRSDNLADLSGLKI